MTTSTKLGWLLIVSTLALVVGGAFAVVPHLPAGWSPVMFGIGVFLAILTTLWVAFPISQSFHRVAWFPPFIVGMTACNVIGFCLSITSFWARPLFMLSFLMVWAVLKYVVVPVPGAPSPWKQIDKYLAPGITDRYNFWIRFTPALLLFGLVAYVVVMQHI